MNKVTWGTLPNRDGILWDFFEKKAWAKLQQVNIKMTAGIKTKSFL